MARTACCLLLIVGIAILPPHAEPDANTPAPGEIPFRLYAGYLIVVQGTLGDGLPCKFAVDTGATYSTIDRRLAHKLGLSSRSRQIFNFDKLVPVETVDVPGVQIGPIRTTSLPMLAADLVHFKTFAAPVDAVIGLDLLRRSNFSIDYAAKKLRFGGPEAAAQQVPMNSGPAFLSVEVRLTGRPIRLLVDSGIHGTLLYEDRAGGQVREARTEARIDGFSIGGRVQFRQATVPRIRLGTTDLDRTVLLMNGPAPNTLPRIDGYLGTSTLHARRIDFNFDTNTLGWTP